MKYPFLYSCEMKITLENFINDIELLDDEDR